MDDKETSGRSGDSRWPRAGIARSAVAELERAHAALGEADAPRLADQAARELRKLGLRVARAGGRAAGHAGVAALSVREREIAELVSNGSTNREIAGALHLSEKTIANHLSRVFAKLEISSRSALAAAIGREDSPHPTAPGAGRDGRVAERATPSTAASATAGASQAAAMKTACMRASPPSHATSAGS